eukprot:7180717-Pyramimonas_sp.AAC.1
MVAQVLESKGGEGKIVPKSEEKEQTLTIVVGPNADEGDEEGFSWEPVVVDTLEMGRLKINIKKRVEGAAEKGEN